MKLSIGETSARLNAFRPKALGADRDHGLLVASRRLRVNSGRIRLSTITA